MHLYNVSFRAIIFMAAVTTLLTTGCATKQDLEKLKADLGSENRNNRQELNTQINSFQGQITDAKVHAGKNSERLETIESSMDRISKSLDEINSSMALSRNIESAQMAFDSLKRRSQQSEDDMKTYAATMKQTEADLNGMRSHNQSLQREISELESKMDEIKVLLEEAMLNQ